SEPKPIRITTDYTFYDQGDVTQQQKSYIKNFVDISKLYFQKLLKIYPLIGNNVFDQIFKGICIDFAVPINDQTIGIPDSDLHLYVIWLQMLDSVLILTIDNLDLLLEELILIQQILEILLLIKILFRIIYKQLFMKFYMYSVFQEALCIFGQILILDIIMEITLKLNCKKQKLIEENKPLFQLPKTQQKLLENIIVVHQLKECNLKMISHWERTVIYNEIMTGTKAYITSSVLSIFTIAALKDTGFYPETNENMANNIFWGKEKDCDFLENACQSTIEYPEQPKKYEEQQCTFGYEGIGIGVSELYAEKCNLIYFYINRLCTNPNSVSSEDDKNMNMKNYRIIQLKVNASNLQLQNPNIHNFEINSDVINLNVPPMLRKQLLFSQRSIYKLYVEKENKIQKRILIQVAKKLKVKSHALKIMKDYVIIPLYVQISVLKKEFVQKVNASAKKGLEELIVLNTLLTVVVQRNVLKLVIILIELKSVQNVIKDVKNVIIWVVMNVMIINILIIQLKIIQYALINILIVNHVIITSVINVWRDIN
ncbi:leishmanolysin family protein, putative, partial [Ichthyophthirius multifiliis]